MEYHIVWADDKKIAYFIAEVNKIISEGWKPQGGVSVATEVHGKKSYHAGHGKGKAR